MEKALRIIVIVGSIASAVLRVLGKQFNPSKSQLKIITNKANIMNGFIYDPETIKRLEELLGKGVKVFLAIFKQ